MRSMISGQVLSLLLLIVSDTVVALASAHALSPKKPSSAPTPHPVAVVVDGLVPGPDGPAPQPLLPTVETLIFSDDFNTFDLSTWKHEITMSGGGNWEFEMYANNRSNSFVRDGVLYMKPTLTADIIGNQGVLTGVTLELWNGAPAADCTDNSFYGCSRASNGANIINPVASARVRTADSFTFKYGRVEVTAKLPKGDWVWPAIWLLPRYNTYGNWPASGEIDIMESRGNGANYPASAGGGVNTIGSTLHWGPHFPFNAYELTHELYTLPTGDFSQDFHTFGLYWDQDILYTYVDSDTNRVLVVDMSTQSFWDKAIKAGLPWQSQDNPWLNGPFSAPFSEEFYITLNVAVGGTNGYFPDGIGGKPWSDTSLSAAHDFWSAVSQWYPTWSGDSVALQIESVNVWSINGTSTSSATSAGARAFAAAMKAAESAEAAAAAAAAAGTKLLGDAQTSPPQDRAVVIAVGVVCGLVGVLVGALLVLALVIRQQKQQQQLQQQQQQQQQQSQKQLMRPRASSSLSPSSPALSPKSYGTAVALYELTPLAPTTAQL